MSCAASMTSPPRRDTESPEPGCEVKRRRRQPTRSPRSSPPCLPRPPPAEPFGAPCAGGHRPGPLLVERAVTAVRHKRLQSDDLSAKAAAANGGVGAPEGDPLSGPGAMRLLAA